MQLDRSIGLAPLQSSVLEPSAARVLDNEMEQAARKAGASHLLGAATLASMLTELAGRGLRCAPEQIECLAKIGLYAGLELLLIPYYDPGPLGPRLCTRLVGVNRARSLRLECVDLEQGAAPQPAQARALVLQILTGEVRSGAIEIQVSVAGASILLDDKPVGDSPLAAPLEGILQGQHWIQVQAEGYDTLAQPVSVLPGEQIDLELTLTARDAESPLGAASAEPDAAAAGDGVQLGALDQTVSSQVETSALGWAGWVTTSLGALGVLAFSATAVTGSVLYDQAPAADVCGVDPGAEVCLARRDARTTGKLLAFTGVLGALGTALITLAGISMLGLDTLE